MIIFYHDSYNIDLGVLNRLHPFDGLKFKKAFNDIQQLPGIVFDGPSHAIEQAKIAAFVDSLLKLLLLKKRYILRALEFPFLPLIPYTWIDRRILRPMRWAVEGTLCAAHKALSGNHCWNLSGGYHHASRASSEGFCIYNDIGIAITQLRKENEIGSDDRVLIIDVDAHHGNGNAYAFLEDRSITLLDIYNADIYPKNDFTRERVDINIPLGQGTKADTYLSKLEHGLKLLPTTAKLAFVIAGTDVLSGDRLGGLSLSIAGCTERDRLILERLSSLSIPSVFLGGGGYGPESHRAISASIMALYNR
jgi:histone deacetylase 11